MTLPVLSSTVFHLPTIESSAVAGVAISNTVRVRRGPISFMWLLLEWAWALFRRRLRHDRAQRGEIFLGGTLNVGGGRRAHLGLVTIEKLVADARGFERGEIPRLACVRAAIHCEGPEQVGLGDAQLLIGHRLFLDTLELLAQRGLGLRLIGRCRAEERQEVARIHAKRLPCGGGVGEPLLVAELREEAAGQPAA